MSGEIHNLKLGLIVKSWIPHAKTLSRDDNYPLRPFAIARQ